MTAVFPYSGVDISAAWKYNVFNGGYQIAMVNQVALNLFGFPIYWYGILIASAVVLGVIVASAREKRLGFKKDTTLDFLLLALPLAVICARAYYVIFAWRSYAAHPISIFNLREGGLAIYGGVIGGLLAAFLFSRYRHISFAALVDLCAPSLVLGQAIGRWGNFFNQEAYGAAVENPALRFFPAAVFIEADGLWHYATFFYESAWCFIVVAVLLLLEGRGCVRRRGDLFAMYLFLYGAERAVVEGLRTDSLMLLSLRVSQWLSILFMLGALIWFMRGYRVTRRRGVLCALAVLGGAALFIFMLAGAFIGQIISAALIAAAGVLLYISPATIREKKV